MWSRERYATAETGVGEGRVKKIPSTFRRETYSSEQLMQRYVRTPTGRVEYVRAYPVNNSIRSPKKGGRRIFVA